MGQEEAGSDSGHILLTRNPTQTFLLPAWIHTQLWLSGSGLRFLSSKAGCAERGICSIPLSPCALQKHTAPLNPKGLIPGSK